MDFWLLPGQEVPQGLSDTPIADEALRKLGEQWQGRREEWKDDGEEKRLDDEDKAERYHGNGKNGRR
jgi:hypothetical protein